MFVCGPTVYDVSHIGHGKTYVAYDIIARYLRRKGYSLFFIINITDVDDKIINKSKQTGENALDISRKFAEEFYKDMETLRIKSANLYAKASDHIQEIIGQIQALISKGLAYQVNGDVYYDVSMFPDYGKLSRQNLDQLNVHRVDPDPRKKSSADFALWKSQKPGEIAWDSPWGKGRPGWHIEDTAITLTYFGATYDIHGGGTDLIFPHHEAEIAEAEGLTGKKPLASYWLHTGLLTIKGQEMHKSLGNFIPIRDLVQKMGVDAVRVFYASTHYRSPLDYTQEALAQAASLARRFQRVYDQLSSLDTKQAATSKEERIHRRLPELDSARQEFYRAMDDDFNTPGALSAYIKIVALGEEEIQSGKFSPATIDILQCIKEMGNVLGILETDTVPRSRFNELANLLLELRSQFRTRRDFSTADRIREDMIKAGIIVEDQAAA